MLSLSTGCGDESCIGSLVMYSGEEGGVALVRPLRCPAHQASFLVPRSSGPHRVTAGHLGLSGQRDGMRCDLMTPDLMSVWLLSPSVCPKHLFTSER